MAGRCSYLAAGVLSTAAVNGQTVACVTATKGEAGSQDARRWPAASLGDIRTAELASALQILGITEHYWLGYQDGCCCDAAVEQAVQRLQTIVEQVQPDTILTFGPDGWTGHDDHKTVSRWSTALVRGSGKDIALYYVVHTPEHYARYYQPAHERLNIFFNIDRPFLIAQECCDIYFALPEEALDRKIAALKAMPSQTERVFQEMSPQFLRETLRIEPFMHASRQAAAPVPPVWYDTTWSTYAVSAASV